MLKIEEIKAKVSESREYDNACKLPPKKLVEELEEAFSILPKYKKDLDAESYRFLRDYISNTVYIAKGKLLK